MSVRTRFQQGIRALFAFATPVEHTLAQQYLSPQQMMLFREMSRSEQLHSLNVLRSVLEQEATIATDLAVAALLHDVGKSRYQLAIWQKTINVLIRTFVPDWYHRLSEKESLSIWRAPFVVSRYHPQWGAELLATTDASERAIWLVEHHQDKIEQWNTHSYGTLLEQLQQADDAN